MAVGRASSAGNAVVERVAETPVAIPKVIVPTNLHIDTVWADIVMAEIVPMAYDTQVFSVVVVIRLVMTMTMIQPAPSAGMQTAELMRNLSRWSKLSLVPADQMRRRAHANAARLLLPPIEN